MTWKDEIREAAFTAAGGERQVFQFEDVSHNFTKKGTVFEFPDSKETYVQESGHTHRRFPLRCIFHGPDCNAFADVFIQELEKSGIGLLEHPMYGRYSVIPFGQITRLDNIKSAANQVFVDVTFFQTIGIIFQGDRRSPTSSINSKMPSFNTAIAEDFADEMDKNPITKKVEAKSFFGTLKEDVSNNLDIVAGATNSVKRQFDAVNRSIDNNFDLFLGDPLTLADQLVTLIQAPARSVALIGEKLTTYTNMARRITRDAEDSVNLYANLLGFRTADLSASSQLSGMVLSSINSTFDTRTKAVEAAETLLNQFDDLTDWRDDNFKNLLGTSTAGSEIDTGDSYQILQDLVAEAAGFLIQLSFELVSERRIILTCERSLHDVVAEYYGTTDDKFDFFINTNNLSGTEIINIPAGKEIVIFV